MAWRRGDDTRPRSLLEESGRRTAELKLASIWTSGIVGPKANSERERGRRLDTVAGYYAANAHGQGRPPAGTT